VREEEEDEEAEERREKKPVCSMLPFRYFFYIFLGVLCYVVKLTFHKRPGKRGSYINFAWHF